MVRFQSRAISENTVSGQHLFYASVQQFLKGCPKMTSRNFLITFPSVPPFSNKQYPNTLFQGWATFLSPWAVLKLFWTLRFIKFIFFI